MLLMLGASKGQGTMAEAILMSQLARLAVAIIDMHKVIGDEVRAAEISRTLNSQMATVASRLLEVPRKVPKRVIAEGDRVAVHSHYIDTPGQRGRVVIDLFRVRDGKFVEYWEGSQDVPETSANNNTMF